MCIRDRFWDQNGDQNRENGAPRRSGQFPKTVFDDCFRQGLPTADFFMISDEMSKSGPLEYIGRGGVYIGRGGVFVTFPFSGIPREFLKIKQ